MEIFYKDGGFWLEAIRGQLEVVLPIAGGLSVVEIVQEVTDLAHDPPNPLFLVCLQSLCVVIGQHLFVELQFPAIKHNVLTIGCY